MSYVYYIFFLVIFIHYVFVMSETTPNYTGCYNTYSCGGVKNISYPFSGGDRPVHCGIPGLELACRDNATTLLLTNDSAATFRVLNLNQIKNTLTLARDDLYNTTCPGSFFNATLNSTVFSDIEDDMLTLIYGCNSPPMPLKPPNQFSCKVRNVEFSDAYSILGPVPADPVLGYMYRCSVSVTVPMSREAGERLTSGGVSLSEALMEGFRVSYSDPYKEMCRECRVYGGECGFDFNLADPLCVCGDRLCPSAPPPPQSPREFRNASMASAVSKSSSKIAIVLAVAGAVIAALGVCCLALFCRKRRKRVAAAKASLSPEAASKEIITTTSSKPVTSSTTSSSFSKSIPSYPTSNSDLGHQSSYFGVQIFNYAELEEATDNFSSSRELGDGGFGAVFYGTLADGRVVAVKRLYENNFRRQEQFMNEVKILAEVRHRNLVHLYGCTPKRSRDLLLVYEYIPNGTVADHLHGNRAKSGLLLWPVRLKIAIETAEALVYLHKKAIIHRDVKTTNILLDNDFTVKVADFGLSRLFPKDVTHVSTAPQGTPGYVDPEYYQVYHLTEKSDVFSFGVVLVELISSLQAVDVSRHRHDINLANMAVAKIQNNAAHELVDKGLGFETSDSVRRMTLLVAELAFRCLQQERDMRPSMEEILEALRGIENGEAKAEVKEEFVEIVVDDVALLKGNFGTPSPDKSAKSSTNNSA